MKYYSEILKRVFDTPEACDAEEKKYLEAEEAKKNEQKSMLEALEMARAHYEDTRSIMVQANKDNREAYDELVKLVRAYSNKYGNVPKEFNNLQFLTEMALFNFK